MIHTETHGFMKLRKVILVVTFALVAATSFAQEIRNGVLTIKYGTTEIKYREYYGNEEIKKVIIPNTVTKIGNSAFNECSNLTEVTIPSSVTSIGNWAFEQCSNLTKITIPSSVTSIGGAAFNGCSNLEEVVFEEGIETLTINRNAFSNCTKLNSITLPKSIKEIKADGILGNKNTRIFHCYLGSVAQQVISSKGYTIDIIGIDEKNVANIDLSYLAVLGNKTINAGLFKNLPFEMIDLNNDITEIGKNAFNDKTIIRVKRNTGGDKCMKANGYYLCGVLADLNFYTKDRSKQISEDFTRILCDDDLYVNWTSYKFNLHELLKIEEVDEKIVLTSFQLYPCKNVTVTDKTGKALIKNKTIQPLTRTVLCDAEPSMNLGDFTVTSDDSFYQVFKNMKINWTVTFDGTIRKTVSGNTDNPFLKMLPVFCREWIASICNYAYVIASKEYEELCYKGIEEKWFVTNEEMTQFLTKEEMDKLLEKTRKHTFQLGHCDGGGLGSLGGNGLWLLSGWFRNLGKSDSHAFFHEFSHNMGWNHEDGNMCNLGRPAPWGKQCWPMMGANTYKQFFNAGELPYMDPNLFNSDLFSYDELHKPDPELDIVKNGVLYIGEGSSRIDSHKKETDFTKVVIPSSAEVIADSAFYDTHLAEITIPESVTKINDSAFYGCLSLEKIVIPDTVKAIGSSAFQNCTSLTSVKIGSGIKEISVNMFKAASLLSEITIPGTVKYIGNSAFQECRKLTKVVIADGVRKIGDNVFNNTALTEITIPSSVTEIGKNITSKNVLWNVKEGTYAYKYAEENGFTIGTLADKGNKILAECANTTSAPNETWPNGVFSKTDERRKWDFSGFITGSGTYTVTFKYTGGTDILRLTDTIFAADGKAIAYFAEQRSVGKSYPETVYNITVPAGTKKLEMFALARAGNSNITGTITVSNMNTAKLVIPEGTETIKDSAYFGSKYEEVELPSGLKKIGSTAFQDSTELKSITIPDTVTEVGSSAFHNCPALTSATIGSGLTKLNTKVFKNTALKEIVIPRNIAIIGEEAFRDCAFLTKVDISYGVTQIYKNAFNNCQKLKSISIPNCVTDIGIGAFQNCTSLTSVKLGSGLRKLSLNLFNSSGLTDITIPGTIETIGEEAFSDCANLTKVTIENGVKEICEKAFWNTGITEIKIPASVTEIGKNVAPKDIIWDVEAGSYAYQFAVQNNFKIKSVLNEKAAKLSADRSIKSAPSDKWENGAFTKEDVMRRWDFSGSLLRNAGGTYTITFKYTSGSDILRLNETLFVADGNAVGYFAEQRSVGSGSCEVVFTINVPDGTRKLEMYALARAGNSDIKGIITVEKK